MLTTVCMQCLGRRVEHSGFDGQLQDLPSLKQLIRQGKRDKIGEVRVGFDGTGHRLSIASQSCPRLAGHEAYGGVEAPSQQQTRTVFSQDGGLQK